MTSEEMKSAWRKKIVDRDAIKEGVRNRQAIKNNVVSFIAMIVVATIGYGVYQVSSVLAVVLASVILVVTILGYCAAFYSMRNL